MASAVMEPPKEEKTAQQKNAELNEKKADSDKQMQIMQRQAGAATVTSVKYFGDRTVIKYKLIENNADNEVEMSSKDEPCAAFIDAIGGLAQHVSKIIFHLPSEQTYQVGFLSVKGVNFKHDDDGIRAQIVSTLTLSSGHAVCVNTPSLPLAHEDPTVAKHTKEAASALDEVMAQTKAFLGGKRATGNLFAKLAD